MAVVNITQNRNFAVILDMTVTEFQIEDVEVDRIYISGGETRSVNIILTVNDKLVGTICEV